MHLKRVELTNFRQHRRLDVDFNGNMIAILGRNGCGKSNLIGAIQYALTGEQPGFTKADLTTWGEKEGSVKLIFTAGHRDEEFVIVRKTNGDVTMKVGGDTIKQARKVEEALKERAGIDKELIRQIVFVPQKGIDSILFDDPKNREVAFQRLIGIGNASKIYEALRTEIAQYDKPQGFEEAIARARAQLAEQQEIVDTSMRAIGRYDEALKKLPSKESLEAEELRLAGAQQAVSAFIRAEESLSDAQRRHEEALVKLNGMGAVSEDKEEKLKDDAANIAKEKEELRKEIDGHKESVRFLNRMKELADAAKSTKEAFDEARAKAESVAAAYSTPLSDFKAEVERLSAEQAAAEAEARSLRNMAKEASSDGTCPVCGAPASQEDISKHLEEKLKEAEKNAAQAVEKARDARMAYDKRHAEEQLANEDANSKKTAMNIAAAALKKAHDANVDGCEIDLETCRVAYRGKIPDELPDIQKQIEGAEKRMSELDRLSSEISRTMSAMELTRRQAKDARDDVARLAAQVDLFTKNKKDCADKLAGMGIDPDTVKDGASEQSENALRKARENLDAYNGILRDMAGVRGQLEAAEKTIVGTRKMIDELVAKKEVEDGIRTKVDVLKRVRDGLHYRELPRIMSQNVMRDLTACVNSYLDQFQAPFVVDAEEEGFGFRCRFIDGRTMPDPEPDASLLSGGQKVALAIAFRMAIYMCYGGELGLLSLDEPTAYLDSASIEHLGELLERVREVAKARGLQIIMATHEPEIMKYLDTKVNLDEIKGE